MVFPLEQNTIVSIIGLIIVGVPVIFGVIAYNDSVKLRRSEWLYKLYTQFYVEPNLKEIRQMIDSEKGKCVIEELIAKDETSLDQKELDRLDQFTDYCNFFEFMMMLKKSGILKSEDVKIMFRYYLYRFSSNIIEKYLMENGFKLLSKYLQENHKEIIQNVQK